MNDSAARLGLDLIARSFGWGAPCLPPPRAEHAPRALFPPRRDLVVGEDDEVCIAIRGRLRPLAFPMAWDESATQMDREALRELHGMRWVEALDDARFQRVLLEWIENAAAHTRGASAELPVLSSRCATWMQQLAARARRMPARFADTVARSLADQVRALEHEMRRAPLLRRARQRGPELLAGARTLCWAGAFFTGPTAERWRERGAGALAHALDHAFRADGTFLEPDAAAHARACVMLLECRAVLCGHAVQPRLDAAIERACAALADRVNADGCPSLLFGGGLHAGPAPQLVLAAARRLCGTTCVERSRIVLEDAGLCGWRDGRSSFLFACGATGAGQDLAHDALALEWTLHGARVLVAGGPISPAMVLEGASAAPARTRRERLQILPDGLVAQGACTARPHVRDMPLHRRLLRSTRDVVCIEDHVEGGCGRSARALFVCHPLARARHTPEGAVTIRRGAVAVRIEARHPLAIEETLWQPDAGLDVRTQRIAVHYGSAPCHGSVRITNLATQPPEMLALVAASAR